MIFWERDVPYYAANRDLPDPPFCALRLYADLARYVDRARHVAPGDHPAFYAASALTLNVTRGAMAALGWCPSGRLFEAAACGAPILSDAWEGLDRFFTPGHEILVAEGTDDAMAALAIPRDDLARIAARARERTLDEHTAMHRARELLALVRTSRPEPRSRDRASRAVARPARRGSTSLRRSRTRTRGSIRSPRFTRRRSLR